MAAVPVSLMHHTGLQIPQMATGAPGAAGQMMLPVSTMLSMNMNAVPLTTSTMTSMMNGGYQPQFQPTELSNGCAQGPTLSSFELNKLRLCLASKKSDFLFSEVNTLVLVVESRGVLWLDLYLIGGHGRGRVYLCGG